MSLFRLTPAATLAILLSMNAATETVTETTTQTYIVRALRARSGATTKPWRAHAQFAVSGGWYKFGGHYANRDDAFAAAKRLALKDAKERGVTAFIEVGTET
jgi:hypothetical protein